MKANQDPTRVLQRVKVGRDARVCGRDEGAVKVGCEYAYNQSFHGPRVSQTEHTDGWLR
jgi:hypothetical protein